MKRSSKQDKKFNLNLLVYNSLKEGLRPSQISKKFNINKSKIQYHLTILKTTNLVKKIGYGVWETISDYDEKKKRSSKKRLMDSPNLLVPDKVRGHGFMFTISIPKLKNWDKRRKILSKNKIKFKPLDNVYGGAEKINFKGRNIILTNKSLIIYEKASYIAENSSGAQNYAIYDLKLLIKSLQRELGCDFSFQGQYKFKVSRQHYALIKNALAKQYDKEGNRLYIYSAGDLWFIIDNSYNLHEAETINPTTAVEDNRKVQDFFNGIKKFEGYTPEFVLKTMQGIQSNQVMNAENIKLHMKLLRDKSKGIKELRREIKGFHRKQRAKSSFQTKIDYFK